MNSGIPFHWDPIQNRKYQYWQRCALCASIWVLRVLHFEPIYIHTHSRIRMKFKTETKEKNNRTRNRIGKVRKLKTRIYSK